MEEHPAPNSRRAIDEEDADEGLAGKVSGLRGSRPSVPDPLVPALCLRVRPADQDAVSRPGRAKEAVSDVAEGVRLELDRPGSRGTGGRTRYRQSEYQHSHQKQTLHNRILLLAAPVYSRAVPSPVAMPGLGECAGMSPDLGCLPQGRLSV
jgi:hypothetical protein